MLTDYEKEIIGKAYNLSNCNTYKLIYKKLFARNPSGCSCACNNIYQQIKSKYEQQTSGEGQ